jgi:amidase
VGRRGLYLNDYWSQLLPWSQDKYDKAKYFVTGTAMSR